MKLYPAIDLIDGHCVRLEQGDFERQKTYSADPLQVAQDFESQGAEFLHVVDLDGARNPAARQLALLENLAKIKGLKVQVGGGIRSLADASALLSLGLDRVVVGSMAVTQTQLTRDMIREFGPSRVTLALDVNLDQSGVARLAIHGWKEQAPDTLEDVIRRYLEQGLQRILVTDIGRDGMLQGPNEQLYSSLRLVFPQLEIQASGGIGSLSDISRLSKSGVHSAIVGKSLYEGKIQFAEALRSC